MGQATSTETSNKSPNYNQPQTQQQNKNVNQPKYEFLPQGQQPVGYGQPQDGNIQNVKSPRMKYKAILTSNDLLTAFMHFAIEGKYLNHVRFNDTIERLFSKIDMPSMHYTFLSEKIYALLDESRDGKISEDEFVIGMKNVLMNKDFRLKLSMMAMMNQPEERNFLEFNEIVEFFFKSWIYGYKHLGWQVKRDKNMLESKGIPVPTITQFELWANKFENHIRIYLTNDFREMGVDISRPIDFETFKKWIYQDHNLRLTYTAKNVIIATSLISLDELGFDDSANVNVPNVSNVTNPNLMRYPTFK